MQCYRWDEGFWIELRAKILQVRAVECRSVEMRGKRISRLGEGVRGMNKERRKVENWVLAKIL